MTRWWNKTGGISYHYLALRFRRNLWQDYLKFIEEFLFSIQWFSSSKPKKLLLLGPSAGYTLPTAWLKGFSEILAIDFDPLAPLLFKQIHGPLPIRWTKENFFSDSSQDWRIDRLLALRQSFPDHLWFFTNLIGQLPLTLKNMSLHKEDQWLHWQQDWHQVLLERNWISLHDIFSVPFGIRSIAPFSQKWQTVSKEELIQNILKSREKAVVTDHLTHGLLPLQTRKELALWRIQPHQTQIIEAATNIF
ncbi:MAG: hypothetical protein IPL83_10030 [Bdellovibrionales bacterium]|nr:hypothetical protein [Bdellovibrionales bacterium]